MLKRLAPGFLVVFLAAGVVPIAPDPAYAADETPCDAYSADDFPPASTPLASAPLRQMGVGLAHREFDRVGKVPGKGVDVAVVDNGVFAGSDLLKVEPGLSIPQGELVDYHGTAVAGLIAGREREQGGAIGIAPGATIIDVRVYDTDTPSDNSQMQITTPHVIEGLEWVADEAKRNKHLKVVNVSLDVDHSPDLQKAVEKVQAQDVVVVAATGNRPGQDDPNFGEFSEYNEGEDAAAEIHPAAYPGVLAVNASTQGMPPDGEVDPIGFVLQNSRTDVAVPTYDAVSIGINGSTCMLNDGVATSWAAAEVSGVVAMLRSWYKHDTAEQIIARIKSTASGIETDPPSELTGAGVVQPWEALVRPLRMTRSGEVVAASNEDRQVPPAIAPQPESDPLGTMKDNAVWWGLFSGGVIVLALLMRPIMTRLRRS